MSRILVFVYTAVLSCFALCKMLFTLMSFVIILRQYRKSGSNVGNLRTDMIETIRNRESEKYLEQNKATGNKSTQCVYVINWG